jgi:hypothetical protein
LNENSVFAPRLYRSPDEIKDEIGNIKNRIEEANERLNVREILDSYLSSAEVGRKECEQLSALLQSALEALDELYELNAALDELRAELLEVISL